MSVAMLVCAGAAVAHDPSAYGGLFRSRDFGGTWLNADVGLFLGGAVSVAINPEDPNHLLLGTDTNLLATRTGGRQWKQESPDKLFGAVTAIAFLREGAGALCSTPAGVFQFDQGAWQSASAPAEAAPAKAIVPAAVPGRVYLVGRRDLFRSDDGGRQWLRVEHALPDQPKFGELVLASAPAETLYAVIDGKPMASVDQGLNWAPRHAGLAGEFAEALTLGGAAGQLWIASADRLYRSENGGVLWRAVGAPFPEAGTSVRGIAADASGTRIVVTTHRGIYRSIDGGITWGLLEGNLPVHLEARPLVRDPAHAETLYAGYSLMPYSEVWRIALEGGNLLGRIDLLSLAGGLAFLILLILLGALGARWLSRRAHPPWPVKR
jgi:photosystem II stability/assembly factor-like uncharacterized protein